MCKSLHAIVKITLGQIQQIENKSLHSLHPLIIITVFLRIFCTAEKLMHTVFYNNVCWQ